MPNIAQQDYIIIDWGGKDSSDVAKVNEVSALLKNIYLANPLALLSVLFKHYGENVTENSYYPIIGFNIEDGTTEVAVVFFDIFNNEAAAFSFSID